MKRQWMIWCLALGMTLAPAAKAQPDVYAQYALALGEYGALFADEAFSAEMGATGALTEAALFDYYSSFYTHYALYDIGALFGYLGFVYGTPASQTLALYAFYFDYFANYFRQLAGASFAPPTYGQADPMSPGSCPPPQTCPPPDCPPPTCPPPDCPPPSCPPSTCVAGADAAIGKCFTKVPRDAAGDAELGKLLAELPATPVASPVAHRPAEPSDAALEAFHRRFFRHLVSRSRGDGVIDPRGLGGGDRALLKFLKLDTARSIEFATFDEALTAFEREGRQLKISASPRDMRRQLSPNLLFRELSRLSGGMSDRKIHVVRLRGTAHGALLKGLGFTRGDVTAREFAEALEKVLPAEAR